ncbi:hypothetical protein H2199_005932 [Coniosporium tulheliwenetii]|uniref:Uncharacterized protein n=1 Tax=Coniosporium tulheliwenetii TaxID=3383036 RepID=A0ACC2YZ19_9PEZI|nr:hypothetical protein H2199_005932 [Cladosporium sp. JES 115]
MKKFFNDKIKERLVSIWGGNRHARTKKRRQVNAPVLEGSLIAGPQASERQEPDCSSNESSYEDQDIEQSAQAQMAIAFYSVAETQPEELETASFPADAVHVEELPHTSETPISNEPSAEDEPGRLVDLEDTATTGDSENKDAFPRSVDCIFETEEESDYTSGPAKMVVAYDGSQECPAIMLDMELSAKLQIAIRGEREMQRTEFLILSDREMLAEREQMLFRRLLAAEQDLEILSKREDHAEVQVAASIQKLKTEIYDLKHQHGNVQEELKSLDEVLQGAYANQRMLQAEANAILDDVFVNCNLLEPQEMQTSMDPELPPVQFSTQQPDGSVPSSIPSVPSRRSDELKYFEARFGPNNDIGGQEDESPQARARRTLIRKRIDFTNAQEKFDRYQDHHGTDPNARQRAAVAGVQITSQTELDLFNLRRGQELTRKLIEAEEAVRAASTEAKLAGVNNDQTSHSGKQMDEDGESLETELMASTDMASVERWLEKVAPDANPDIAPDGDADDWDFEVDDRPWDSVSTMAQCSERRKIDR